MTEKQNIIVLTTGGSGGHIFPAEACAAALIKKGYTVVFITDKRGSAFRQLENVATYRLCAESITGRNIVGKFVGFAKLIAGSVQALFLLRKIKPKLVIGFGGYASIPAVMAAQVMHIPTILHEQNSVLGRANRILARGTKLIATTFPFVKKNTANKPIFQVGQPVREPTLAKANTPFPAIDTELNVLIFGGSQGAHFFSNQLADALMLLPEELRKKINLTQQARPEDMDALRTKYQNANFHSLEINSFFNNMPELLAASHLVIGRGGAGTLTEVMTVGRPALIIPLPTAADNHQYENACLLTQNNAGWVLQEKDFNAESLAKQLTDWLMHPEQLQETAKRAQQLAILNAADRIADVVQDLLKDGG
ncbi:MAG: undecaprenyldiphospho-muramoylpentapeptide beta-N-acetylglucosaminyltransferase [Alphaproteobacteria bacterium]|nr:undecaprenyldiphospho-muramoylpentapeptide beta-N-acetylglucosaminyltransferase [Alphaproteobacteria bacterium]